MRKQVMREQTIRKKIIRKNIIRNKSSSCIKSNNIFYIVLIMEYYSILCYDVCIKKTIVF